MNPIILGLAALAAVATVVGAYAKGESVGRDAEKAKFERAISVANDKHAADINTMNTAIRDKDVKLAEVEASQQKLARERDDALNEAQSKLPLSEACNVCRIPAGRINSLREGIGKGGDKATATGTSAAPVAR